MIDPFHRAFGETVRELRKELAMSQETLACKAGLNRTYISALEQGKHSPTLSSLVLFAWAFDTSPSDLIRMAEERTTRGQRTDGAVKPATRKECEA